MADKPVSRSASNSGWMVMDKTWEVVQKKTFTKWFNAHLKKAGHKNQVEELTKDLATGVMLHQLLESISGQRLPKIMATTKFRLQNIQNLNVCLDFIARSGVKLVGISSEEITDGNLKLILGMIWTLILRFEIQDISVEDLTAKEGLLYWCQKKTHGYKDVEVKDFTRSWHDGLAFCALIHKHRPDLLSFDQLSKGNPEANLELAFSIAEKQLGIPRFLDVEDMPVADERAVMTYLLQFFHLFAGSQKAEVAGRRISKLVNLMQANEELQSEYERRAKEFSDWSDGKHKELDERAFDNTLEGARKMLDELVAYQNQEKPQHAADKLAVEGIFANLQVKLRNNKRAPYQPPAGLSPDDLAKKWDGVLTAEAEREKAIREEIARQEKMEDMARRFYEKLAKLKAWEKAKKEYLQQRPVIDTLIAAQSQLKLLDSFDKLYGASKPRVAELHTLGDDLVKMGYRDSDKIKEELQWTDGAWEGMAKDAADKRAWLEEQLRIQEEMERLRIEFAEKAKKLSRWHKDTSEAVAAEHSFGGDSLDEVVAYEPKLAESDAALMAESHEKKAELEAIAKRMEELGVKDNKYTVITMEDIGNSEKGLEAAIAARREAYEAEKRRQEAMEAKRVEFANAAQAFMDWLAAQNAEVEKVEGEDPSAVIAAVEGIVQAGAPGEEKLKDVRRIDQEAIAMQITSNKHTKWTVPQLEAEFFDAIAAVDRYVDELHEEQERKNKYAERAARLLKWVEETMPTLAEKKEAVGSLGAARTKRAEYNEYRTGKKPPKSAEKAAVIALAAQLTAMLAASSHHRPAFVPPAGLAPEDINAAWKQLDEAEKALAEFVAAEIQRHERLAALEKRIHEEARDLEQWAKRKDEYLKDKSEEERISSLGDAQVCIHRLDSYVEEHAARGPKFSSIKADAGTLADEKQDGAEKAAEHVAAVEAAFAALDELEKAKRAALEECLERERKREELRLAFAEKAKEYAAFSEKRADDLEETSFGNDLESVKAFKEKLDETENTTKAESAEKKDALAKLAADMEAAGITSNPHTSLTMDDVQRFAEKVDKALADFHERYEKEVARQEAMEAKRLEFAEAAQALADLLAASRAAVDALEGDEPAELKEAVKAKFAEAAAEKAKLADVERIHSEGLRLEVTENKHTKLTPAGLKRAVREYVQWVNAYVAELDEEAAERSKYTKRSAALMAWADETGKLLAAGGARPMDNTLNGAQAAMAAFTDYRDSTKPAKVVEKDALKTLHDNIASGMKASKHHRPEFKAEHTPDAIAAAFAGLAETENAHFAAVKEELAKQEDLSNRARDFESSASDVEAWCKQAEEELTRDEHAETVEAAQIAADVLAAFDKDYEDGATTKLAPVKDAAAGLEKDNYSEAPATTKRSEEVSAMWDGLKAPRETKAARVAEAGTREEAKEKLRLQWAKEASKYDKWVREQVGKVSKYAFGTSLDAVRSAEQPLTESSAELRKNSEASKAALVELDGKLKESGATENVHSQLTIADVEKSAADLEEALAKREAAYKAELAQQEAMEEKRLEFAAKVKEFTDKVSECHAALEKVAGDDPDKCAEEAKAIYSDDVRKSIADALAACAEADLAAKNLKVVENKHTPYTMAALQRKLAAHDKYYENLLAALGEDKRMKDRQGERAAEWKKKEEIETLRSQFSELQAKLAAWADGVSEALAGTPEVSTVEEVDELAKDLEQHASDAVLEEQKATYSQLQELNGKLVEAGVPAGEVGLDAATATYEEAKATVAARKDWIAKEKERQGKHDALRKKYAAEAEAFHAWIDEQKGAAPPQGELEKQLQQVVEQEATATKTGKEKESSLTALDKELKDAGVVGNPLTKHTTAALSLELKQLLDMLASRKSLLEGQINSTKFSLPQEEISEIIDLFKQFDRDHTGLQPFQFKAVMSAIGEDLDDDKAKAEFNDIDKDKSGTINQDEFVQYMTKRRADSDSKEDILAAFRDIAGGRDCVTAAELAPVVTPEQLKYIQDHAPRKEGQPDAYDFAKWCDSAFA